MRKKRDDKYDYTSPYGKGYSSQKEIKTTISIGNNLVLNSVSAGHSELRSYTGAGDEEARISPPQLKETQKPKTLTLTKKQN
jgi:hypothetical protein